MKKKRLSNSEADQSIPLKYIPIMVSGCLLGICCRYDGSQSPSHSIIRFASSANIIPFCPEQLGGLPTPRHPAKIVGGDGRDVFSGKATVINDMGEDVTDAYKKGAEQALRVARLVRSTIALLREKSPSCGLTTPYCEKSTHSGMGVTAALFRRSGIKMFDINPNEDFPSPDFLELFREIS
jgi:uncharacterized protein YbbK (DUF523 family)